MYLPEQWETKALLVPDQGRWTGRSRIWDAALLLYIASWGDAAGFYERPAWEGLQQLAYYVETLAKGTTSAACVSGE